MLQIIYLRSRYRTNPITQDTVKVSRSHLKSEPSIKLTTVIQPIELYPASTTTVKTPGERVRNEVHALEIVNSPVLKM